MSWKKEIDELAARRAMAEKMGGEEKVARQHGRGKLDARARLAGISDSVSLVNNRAPDPDHLAEVVAGLHR